MPDDPPVDPQRLTLLDILNGEAGSDAHYEACRATIMQHIDATFSFFRLLATDQAASNSIDGTQFVYLK